MQVWNVLHAARWKYRTQKMMQKIAICAPSHNIVGLYLHNWGTYWQSEKNLLSSNIFPTCPYNVVNFGPLAAEIVSLVWGTPTNFNGIRVLAALLHSQTAALNRGRHLYSTGRPSRWALAHVSSFTCGLNVNEVSNLWVEGKTAWSVLNTMTVNQGSPRIWNGRR